MLRFSTRAPAGDALAERFRTVEFRESQIPVIFNCLGAERPDGAAIPELLVRQGLKHYLTSITAVIFQER